MCPLSTVQCMQWAVCSVEEILCNWSQRSLSELYLVLILEDRGQSGGYWLQPGDISRLPGTPVNKSPVKHPPLPTICCFPQFVVSSEDFITGRRGWAPVIKYKNYIGDTTHNNLVFPIMFLFLYFSKWLRLFLIISLIAAMISRYRLVLSFVLNYWDLLFPSDCHQRVNHLIISI